MACLARRPALVLRALQCTRARLNIAHKIQPRHHHNDAAPLPSQTEESLRAHAPHWLGGAVQVPTHLLYGVISAWFSDAQMQERQLTLYHDSVSLGGLGMRLPAEHGAGVDYLRVPDDEDEDVQEVDEEDEDVQEADEEDEEDEEADPEWSHDEAVEIEELDEDEEHDEDDGYDEGWKGRHRPERGRGRNNSE